MSHALNEKLVKACRNGDLSFVNYYLSAGADINTKLEGKSPLYTAAQNSHIHVAKALISLGADIESRYYDEPAGYLGWTPLIIAAKNGHLQMAELLLKSGALVDALEGEGSSALMSTHDGGR